MATVWSDRKAEPKASARQARDKYQKKEMELEDERARLTRLQAELRGKQEELRRLTRGIEKRELEILQFQKSRRDLGRIVEEFGDRARQQKAKVSRLEHEAEQLREAAFRGRSFGV